MPLTWSTAKARLGAFRWYVALLVLVGVCVYLGSRLGNWHAAEQQQRIDGLVQSLENVNQENNELVRRLNILGVELEVARLAAQKSQQAIADNLERNNELRRELSFYQKVMAPELEEEGFVIDSLHIEPTNSDNYFRYALVLMQRSKRTGYVAGQARVLVRGSRDGKPAQVNLFSVADEGTSTAGFKFKYFEVIEGEVALPNGFVPEQIVVSTQLDKAKWGQGQLQRTFDWESLITG